MEITAAQLQEMLNAELVGDPDVVILGPGKIEEAGPGEITFLSNLKYEAYAYTTQASVILVSRDFEPKHPIRATLLRVDNVHACVSMLLNSFGGKLNVKEGVSQQAEVDTSAKLGVQVSVGPFSVISEGAEIGDNTVLFPQVFIGKDVKVGKNCILHPGVKVQDGCVLGDRCIINANTVIGSDGFGFLPKSDGSFEKIAQTGNVVLEDDVEIGANSCVDRASIGSTVIRRGAKLDNLIMVAHNVEIGAHTVVAAQAGFAGSSKIGKGCMIGGQAGFVGHIQVADGTKVQAQSGVNKSIKEENKAWYGSPILPYNDYLRSYAAFRKLPELMRKVRELEQRLGDG